MRRSYIRLGDKTTAGGVVIEGQDDFIIDGVPIAFRNAKIVCPKCKSTGILFGDGGDTRVTLRNGYQAAVHGDICICGCKPPPRLIASQDTAWEEVESVTPVVASSAATASAATQLNAKNPALDLSYGKRFCLVDSTTALPLASRPFIVTVNGVEQTGVSDAAGYAYVDAQSDQMIEIHITFASPKKQIDLTRGI